MGEKRTAAQTTGRRRILHGCTRRKYGRIHRRRRMARPAGALPRRRGQTRLQRRAHHGNHAKPAAQGWRARIRYRRFHPAEKGRVPRHLRRLLRRRQASSGVCFSRARARARTAQHAQPRCRGRGGQSGRRGHRGARPQRGAEPARWQVAAAATVVRAARRCTRRKVPAHARYSAAHDLHVQQHVERQNHILRIQRVARNVQRVSDGDGDRGREPRQLRPQDWKRATCAVRNARTGGAVEGWTRRTGCESARQPWASVSRRRGMERARLRARAA
mmetsp:Transcript_6802/g.15489  ORF Transcript_6802/g.15489 Transcript_6802/m.15489 type:complete len:274 (-) Transcript_6802:1222-2043(-)